MLLVVLFRGGYPAEAGAVSPRNGGAMPGGYLNRIGTAKDQIHFKHAWTAKRLNNFKKINASEGLSYYSMPIVGRMIIPVVLGRYSDSVEQEVSASELETELFSGPWESGTLSEYYGEASSGRLEVTGEVFDWISLEEVEIYYTAFLGGLVPGESRTGEMITELIDALDPEVDFGAYDNDGPDGMPNSGDDDGFVDVLIVVHPDIGAECTNNLYHMWSHSWHYSAWPVSGGSPYRTDDEAAGGGAIEIEDYIIGPALSCSSGMIEIGVFCHELGHAFGLPDLYDYDGGSSGVGDWGLMGSGNWNTPSSPAHPCAWSKEQLGWLSTVGIGWREEALRLNPVVEGGQVARIDVSTKRFRRMEYGLYGDDFGLVCGYTESEAAARGWPSGAGYGNGWSESMIHEFRTVDSPPCTLMYSIFTDIEADYDFSRVILETGGVPETLAVYTGNVSKRDTVILDPYLPAGPSTFTIRFLFDSDFNVSDEDGSFDSMGGWTFTVDEVTLAGAGLDYYSDFGSDAGGWRNDSEPAEYFLLEYRERRGFDSHLHGEGLLIWHAENSIAYSAMGNSGGYSNDRARGVVLEEADGMYNLLEPEINGGNRGDGRDPFPGITGNHRFDSYSAPDSRSNGGIVTPVAVKDIVKEIHSVSAVLVGGMPAPSISGVQPDTVWKSEGNGISLDISGNSIQHGSQCYLSMNGYNIEPTALDWRGETRLIAAFDTDELVSGCWDLDVSGADGQLASLASAVRVVSVYLSSGIVTGRDYIQVEWDLDTALEARGCLLYRSRDGGDFELLNASDTLRSPSGRFSYRDFTVSPETDYAYRIVSFLEGGGEEALLLKGPFLIEDHPFIVDGNYPNPFSSETSLSFFVPSWRSVSVDIYDVTGRLVESMGVSEYGRGQQTMKWKPSEDLSSGVYFCVFRSGRRHKVLKLVLIR